MWEREVISVALNPIDRRLPVNVEALKSLLMSTLI